MTYAIITMVLQGAMADPELSKLLLGGPSQPLRSRERDFAVAIEQYSLCVRVLNKIFEICPGDLNWMKNGVGSCYFDGTKDGVTSDFRQLRIEKNSKVSGGPEFGACQYHRRSQGCSLGDLKGPICAGFISEDNELPPSFNEKLIGPNGLFYDESDLTFFLNQILKCQDAGANRPVFNKKIDPRNNWPAVNKFLQNAGAVYQDALQQRSKKVGSNTLVQIEPASSMPIDSTPISNSITPQKSTKQVILGVASNVGAAIENAKLSYPVIGGIIKYGPRAVTALSVVIASAETVSSSVDTYKKTNSIVSAIGAGVLKVGYIATETAIAYGVAAGAVAAVGAGGTAAAVVGGAALIVYGGIRIALGPSVSVESAVNKLRSYF